MKLKVLLIVSFFVLPFLIVAQEEFNYKYVEGELLIGVPDGAFNFPLDVYAGYVSYSQGSDSIIIDSLVYLTFKPGTRQIVNEKILSPAALKTVKPELYNKISMNFGKEIIAIFKKYDVYFIEGVKTFAPSDTIPHYITNRRGKKVLTKSYNFNRSLLIKFNKKYNIQKFAQDLKKVKGISYAQPNEITKEFTQPNDSDYSLYQQTYLGSQIMNFEGAWDNVKGDNSYYETNIAFIDRDFTNCNIRTDLSGNLNTNGPGNYVGSGTGHGTQVASVACAITNNSYLISGATWNSKFIPFLGQTQNEIRNALTQIRDYLNDFNYDNDCYVINMSIGYTSSNSDIEALCNDLYNNYAVLIIAAVGTTGTSDVMYPANHSTVIGVSAASVPGDNSIALNSNWGDDVELLAAGEVIRVLNHSSETSIENSGPSIAASFVSSLCALILSTSESDQLSNAQIRNLMNTTAKEINDHSKTFYRINANDAISELLNPTGFEDGIVIETGPTTLTENMPVTYTSYFIDVPPLGAYIPIWDWKIILKHTQGEYTLVSGQEFCCPYDSEWETNTGELPGGYHWIVTEDCKISGKVVVEATDSEGYYHISTYDIEFELPQLPSTISSNFIMNKSYLATQDITVQNGVTMTILSGNAIFFDENIEFIINGKLDAQGTVNNKIFFTSRYRNPSTNQYWNKIKFNDSANDNSILKYCDIEYAIYGTEINKVNMTIENCNYRNINNTAIKITSANPSISECDIQNNGYGIYLYQSNPTLSNNQITNSTNEGIYMSSSSPVLKNNSIINNYDNGIFAYGGSPQFGTGMGSDGNNIIIDNSGIGIYSVSSNINMGSCVGCHSNGGKNSIYNNTSNCGTCHEGSDEIHVWATNNSDIVAEGNWWGSNPPSSLAFIKDESSKIDYNPWLSSDPNESKSKNSLNNLAILLSKSTESFDHSQLKGLEYGRYKQQNKDYIGAIREYEKVINTNFLLIDSRYALRNMSDCYYITRQAGFNNYLESVIKNYPKSELCKLALQLKSDLFVDMGMYNDAISVNNTIIRQYPDDDILKRNALYNKIMIYYINMNDKLSADQVFTELKQLYQTSKLCTGDKFIAHINDLLNSGSNIKFENSMAQVIDIPNEFILFNNYPNPFNPSTTITFELPKYSQVEIFIYDALGKKIKTLLSENMETGSYNTVWNGTNQSRQQVSSGIYFYTFKAKALDESKETFVKSAKLLLLR